MEDCIQAIRKSLSSETIYDTVIQAMDDLQHAPLSTMQAIRDNHTKKRVGDAWESFCHLWLIHTKTCDAVWTLQDWHTISSDLPPGYQLGKQDNGIDLIGRKDDAYYAIQCKYRGIQRKVPWGQLSTFIGLCERTGPWERYIVMCSGSGVSGKKVKSSKDRTLAGGTFRKTARPVWEAMAQLGSGYRLSDHEAITPTDVKAQRLAYYDRLMASSSANP